jgi:hypothetical protein
MGHKSVIAALDTTLRHLQIQAAMDEISMHADGTCIPNSLMKNTCMSGPSRVRQDTTPCPSGAHFRGNCKCIGVRGLRHRREDEVMGIQREWDWYHKIYGRDPYHPFSEGA